MLRHNESPEKLQRACAKPSVRRFFQGSVSFFEYLEKIELYCSKENHNLGLTGQLRFNLACNRENEDLMRFILSYHIHGAVSLLG